LISCLAFALENTLIDTSYFDEAIGQEEWGFILRNINKSKVMEGMGPLFKLAKDSGIKTAVVTNLPTRVAKKILYHSSVNVDILIGLHDVTQPKPSSEGILKICKKLGVRASELLYIGDSECDYLAAHDAKAPFIGVSWASINAETKLQSPEEISIFVENQICQNSLGERETPLLREGNSFFAGYYGDNLRTDVLDFKNGNKSAIARWTNYIGHRSSALPRVDIIVRALGHSEILVQKNTSLDLFSIRLSQTLRAQYEPSLLKKRHANEKSTNLNRAQRLAQIEGLYIVNSENSASKLTGSQTFLIVDDVVTTGATTNDITRALISHFPEAIVYVLSLVKTARGGPDSKQRQHNFFTHLAYTSTALEHKQSGNGQNKSNQVKSWLQQKNYTANYSHTNHNFVIQNLPWRGVRDQSREGMHSAIAILKNIFQRGSPTEASRYLREKLKISSSLSCSPVPLISSNANTWRRTIKGDKKRDYNPAKILYETLLPKYLGDYSFICNLIAPEQMLNEITNEFVPHLHNRQVDFFLPQAGVIIEVDGKQHKESRTEDQGRDDHALRYGLNTIRFTTDEINEENDSFLEKVNLLISYVQSAITITEQRKEMGDDVFSLDDYKNEIANPTSTDNPSIVLTSVIRFQLLILELLNSGSLAIGEPWSFTIKNRDDVEFIELALVDLGKWLKTLLSLQNIDFPDIESNVRVIQGKQNFPSNTDSINIDFSVRQRFTDLFQETPDVIFVRTHYLDEHRYFEQGSSSKLSSIRFMPYDYFEAETIETVAYDLDLTKGSQHYNDLNQVLSNVFLPYSDSVEFRDGQIGIIGSALSLKSTIGLLPTGSGKSICFQLCSILQPAISFVVCPIKSLMYDQQADLEGIGFTRSAFITGDLTPDEKERVQTQFGQGKFLLLFISPERFQTTKFRDQLSTIAYDRSIAYAVIDEVHCLSEWGHNFRTSYLNLANTIDRFCPGATYIGLTATASVNVLKDIQNEFNIPNNNVKTPLSFTRKELKFSVVDDQGDKRSALIQQVKHLESKWENLQGKNQPGGGIIFTHAVNGENGCYAIANELQKKLNLDVRFYSGSAPNKFKSSHVDMGSFDKYKNQVQADFKSSNFHLLAATKAFGMGVNKGNVAYTVHYGIPDSVEALYQEAGRAGRSKELFIDTQADCMILLGKEKNSTLLETVWDPKTTIEELKSIQTSLDREGDINSNLWFMTNSLEPILSEYELINAVYKVTTATDKYKLKINARDFTTTSFLLERTIYRLAQLGIVSDWTVEDFFSGVLEVHLTHAAPSLIHQTLQKTIAKYDSNINLNSLAGVSGISYAPYFEMKKNQEVTETEFCFLILLQWSYEHFIYNRRQSLKNIYEQCINLSSNRITPLEFKTSIENYFKFDDTSDGLTYVIDNPREYTKWFDVFEYSFTTKPLKIEMSRESLSALREQVGRFLESYRDNSGLNFISGMVRLCLNDFENADGRARFELALEYLRQRNEQQQCEFATLLCGFSNALTVDQKHTLTESVCRYIDQIAPLKILQAEFKDHNTLYSLLNYYSHGLSQATNVLKEKSWLK